MPVQGGPLAGMSFAQLKAGGTGVVELVRPGPPARGPTPWTTQQQPLTPTRDEPLHRTLSLRLATGRVTPEDQHHHHHHHQAAAQEPAARTPHTILYDDLLARHPEFAIVLPRRRGRRGRRGMGKGGRGRGRGHRRRH
ncbi:hypothetical protein MYCTH_2301624 [Thermothelomyces thermophilus ATCC 42464]|uniref:Uncharacterized protein n=1 Tax=Thermothelomyces thermophilus (strain ATCC 42464 / BCRC 31852 / DSM 1799) TaxID=573729 RepID=G2Q9T4_THET4|nr:uncharacterized protein MYCTH_2301624 [Thermothelomyces thermophilus ATCC 42464]AEO56543.1 hypothetical protein MYCTH_2301624 [Thermothelomyces thermophilus ATCC 42464]